MHTKKNLRIILNIDGPPIASRSHTHPSHSQTSRLLSSSLSLGIPFPRSTQCVRGFQIDQFKLLFFHNTCHHCTLGGSDERGSFRSQVLLALLGALLSPQGPGDDHRKAWYSLKTSGRSSDCSQCAGIRRSQDLTNNTGVFVLQSRLRNIPYRLSFI